MDDFDLAKALGEYRKKHGLTHLQMAKRLNMSRAAYDRHEDGVVKPSYEQTQKIRKALNLYEPVKWYRSKMMRWVNPIIIAYLVLSILVEMVGFREGYGGEQRLKDHPPTPINIVAGAVFCVIYWYYWPPVWPFKKRLK